MSAVLFQGGNHRKKNKFVLFFFGGAGAIFLSSFLSIFIAACLSACLPVWVCVRSVSWADDQPPAATHASYLSINCCCRCKKQLLIDKSLSRFLVFLSFVRSWPVVAVSTSIDIGCCIKIRPSRPSIQHHQQVKSNSFFFNFFYLGKCTVHLTSPGRAKSSINNFIDETWWNNKQTNEHKIIKGTKQKSWVTGREKEWERVTLHTHGKHGICFPN